MYNNIFVCVWCKSVCTCKCWCWEQNKWDQHDPGLQKPLLQFQCNHPSHTRESWKKTTGISINHTNSATFLVMCNETCWRLLPVCWLEGMKWHERAKPHMWLHGPLNMAGQKAHISYISTKMYTWGSGYTMQSLWPPEVRRRTIIHNNPFWTATVYHHRNKRQLIYHGHRCTSTCTYTCISVEINVHVHIYIIYCNTCNASPQNKCDL